MLRGIFFLLFNMHGSAIMSTSHITPSVCIAYCTALKGGVMGGLVWHSFYLGHMVVPFHVDQLYCTNSFV